MAPTSAKAANAAFDEASMEIDLNGVDAWEAYFVGHDIEIKILAHNQSDKTLLTYGCHLHGPYMACHEEHHNVVAPTAALGEEHAFEEMMTAQRTGLSKLSKTLQRQGSGLEALQTLKVWKFEDLHGHSHDEHEHGVDTWIKATYSFNGELKTTFIQCHQHAGEAEYACHYKRSGLGEPSLDEDDDHDHDH